MNRAINLPVFLLGLLDVGLLGELHSRFSIATGESCHSGLLGHMVAAAHNCFAERENSAMRAAQRVGIGNRRGPPAFALVILLVVPFDIIEHPHRRQSGMITARMKPTIAAPMNRTE